MNNILGFDSEVLKGFLEDFDFFLFEIEVQRSKVYFAEELSDVVQFEFRINEFTLCVLHDDKFELFGQLLKPSKFFISCSSIASRSSHVVLSLKCLSQKLASRQFSAALPQRFLYSVVTFLYACSKVIPFSFACALGISVLQMSSSNFESLRVSSRSNEITFIIVLPPIP